MSRKSYGLLFLLLALAASACGPRATAPPSYDPAPPPRFIGRQACEGCHEVATANWRGSDHDRAIVEGILRLADSLNLDVVAEGIETTGQRDLLTAMGCRYGQGYLFAKPNPAASPCVKFGN